MRLTDLPELLGGQLVGVDVVDAAAIGGEQDVTPVGREAGIDVGIVRLAGTDQRELDQDPVGLGREWIWNRVLQR